MDKISRYSLPRHTNLAPLGKRIGACIVDLAIFIAGAAALFFGCSNLIFRHFWTDAMSNVINGYDLKSQLAYLDEKGDKQFFDSTDDYTVFDNQLRYYYLNYLTGEGIENPDENAAPNYKEEMTLEDGSKVLPKDYYTVSWFNQYVYEMNPSDPFGESKNCYFTYQKDADDQPLLNEFGVAQSIEYDAAHNLSNTDRVTFMRLKYRSAYNELTKMDFYAKIYHKFSFLNALKGMIPLFVSAIIGYVIVPYFVRNGQTVGKIFFKLGLASMGGYTFDRNRLFLRFVPFTVVWLAATFFLYNYVLIMSIILVAILVSSFALMMASPKHNSLHDYVAQSIVIDNTTSIIFDDSIEEEVYIEREDKAEEERILAKNKGIKDIK